MGFSASLIVAAYVYRWHLFANGKYTVGLAEEGVWSTYFQGVLQCNQVSGDASRQAALVFDFDDGGATIPHMASNTAPRDEMQLLAFRTRHVKQP